MPDLKICITGASGRISHALIPLLLSPSTFKDDIQIELSLLDVDIEICVAGLKGLSLELEDCNYHTLKKVSYSTNPNEAFKDCDLIIFLGGSPRLPGMERSDLAFINADIVYNYAKQISIHAPDSIILIATNPVDVMTTIALEASGFDKTKVIGIGNHLDSLRLKTYFSKQININSSEVHTRVIGEHGDHMVPLLSSTTIGGIPLKYFIQTVDIDIPKLISRLRKAGNTIISKKGATEYGPSYAISNLISTIISDSHKILTVSTYLNGEIAGVDGVSLGVPVVLSKKGIVMIVAIHMNDYEENKFKQAAEVVRQSTDEVKSHLNY